jgi:hypothetical protein
MKNRLISDKELLTLKILSISVFGLILFDICCKVTNGYNRAISEAKLSFWISDCYKVFENYPFFVLFSFFIFLTSLALKSFTKSLVVSIFSFLSLTLSLMQATFLSVWFSELTNIKWNSSLIQNSLTEIIIYLFFFAIIFLKLKIIYRFAKARFQAKIPLR